MGPSRLAEQPFDIKKRKKINKLWARILWEKFNNIISIKDFIIYNKFYIYA